MITPTSFIVDDTHSQHVLQSLNGPLCLPICLRMKCCAEIEPCAKGFLQAFPKVRSEPGSRSDTIDLAPHAVSLFRQDTPARASELEGFPAAREELFSCDSPTLAQGKVALKLDKDSGTLTDRRTDRVSPLSTRLGLESIIRGVPRQVRLEVKDVSQAPQP
uniref:Uncharacterized protein n=1 Tax=Ananas comosus var. bracteatus TaxID=296719 RepID=A0A6V7QHM3_ANACO|nr:unnamed protein product [Ananas comosus var. bracteatus]